MPSCPYVEKLERSICAAGSQSRERITISALRQDSLAISQRRLFGQRGPAQSVIAPRSQTEAISQQVTAADIISLAGLQTGSISRREFVRCRFPCRLFTLPLSIFRQGRLAEEGRPRPRRVVDTSHRNQAYKHAKQRFQQNPPPKFHVQGWWPQRRRWRCLAGLTSSHRRGQLRFREAQQVLR